MLCPSLMFPLVQWWSRFMANTELSWPSAQWLFYLVDNPSGSEERKRKEAEQHLFVSFCLSEAGARQHLNIFKEQSVIEQERQEMRSRGSWRADVITLLELLLTSSNSVPLKMLKRVISKCENEQKQTKLGNSHRELVFQETVSGNLRMDLCAGGVSVMTEPQP